MTKTNDSSKTAISAYEQMLDFNRQFDTKDIYKKMQSWQIANNPDDGVFFPSGNLYYISPIIRSAYMAGMLGKTKVDDMDADQLNLLRYFWGLHLFGSWRNSLGVYRIDKDIFNQIIQSPIPDDTPIEIFSRLPEWCVYLQFPEDAMGVFTKENGIRYICNGFWALFDRIEINGTSKTTLNIVIDIADGSNLPSEHYQPQMLVIEDGMNINQALMAVFESQHSDLKDQDVFSRQQEVSENKKVLSHLLSLLLWLCAEEPDISNINGEPITGDQLRLPKYRRNKKTGVFIPPSQPLIYNIGSRLGGEVRTFNKRNNTSDSRISSRKRPHIRRGHWHGVWSGTGQNKQFKIYWQPAIFVNAG